MSARAFSSLIAGVLLVALTRPEAAHASPWGREAGEIFLSSKSSYFVASGPASPDRERFERIDADVYVEWGAPFGFTAGGKALFGSSTYFDGVASYSADGVSEFEAYLQKRIAKSSHDALSLRVAGAKPTRFQSGARPDLASDGADAELRVLYGRDLVLRPVKVFATAETAYRRRFGPGADQLRADALIGIERGRALFLIESQMTKSLSAAEPGGTRYDLVRLQATVVYRVSKRLSVQIGGVREIAGRGVLRGKGAFAGFWTQF
jgi:hypothetical protein